MGAEGPVPHSAVRRCRLGLSHALCGSSAEESAGSPPPLRHLSAGGDQPGFGRELGHPFPATGLISAPSEYQGSCVS